MPSSTPTAKFFRALAGHTIVYGMSALIRPLSQLILVRLHTNTHFVSVDGYAAWTLLQIALHVGVVVFNMGIATTFFRYYLLAETDSEKDAIISKAFRLTAMIALIGGILVFLTSRYWTFWLTGQHDLEKIGHHIAFAVIGNTLTIIPLAYLRAEGKKWLFVSFNVLKLFLLLGLNGWLLIGMKLGLSGITLAFAVTNLFLAVLFVPLLGRRILPATCTTSWDDLLRYGIPLIATEVVLYALNGTSQIMLRLLGTETQVALFGFGLRIALLSQVAIVVPFYTAFGPMLFKAKKEMEDPRPLYARTMVYIWVIALWVCLGITMLVPELAIILGKNPFYHQAIPIVGWIAFGAAFYGIFFVFSTGASLKDKTWVFPIILSITLIVEIILNYFMIRWWGINGAARGLFSAYVVLALLTLVVNQKTYPVQYPWKRFFIAGAVILQILLLSQLPGFGTLPVRLALALSFPLFLVLYRFLDEGEKKAIGRFRASLRK